MTDLVTLPEIIKGIKKKNVLLPHFQREYVWNKTQQKNLILSVLTNLPSSSSLILKKQFSDKFKCLKIGMRDEIIEDTGDGDCFYLLDGQQRFTTLFYAFHNIFNSDDKSLNEKEFDKLDNKLKKRWYLNFKNNGDSVLNYDDLVFDKIATKELLPEDLESFIEFGKLNRSDLKTHKDDLEQIENYCKVNKKIPLFFFLDHRTELKRILKKIFDDRLDEIISKRNNKKKLIKILDSKNFENAIEKVNRFYNKDSKAIEEIEKFLEFNGYKDEWVDGIFDHFHEILKNYEIQPIVMEDRNKAVKTFEYINTGGTNLSSFDLLCAKIGSFDLRHEVINATREEFLFFDRDYNKKKIRLYEDFGLIGGNFKNPSVEKRYAEYLSQVLNLLHFKEFRKKTPIDKDFSPNLLKSKYSLDELTPRFIESNYLNAVDVILKTSALLQFFCSHKDLNSITNKLSLIQIFTYFIYQDSEIESDQLKCIIGLFWLRLFTGRYNSHQNENSIEDAKNMYKYMFINDVSVKKDIEKLLSHKVLNIEDFATKELLSSQKCSNSLENNLFMFLRSRKDRFFDLLKEPTEITIKDDIEIHHIIPLGEATKVGESTQSLRKKNNHLLNATMNRTPITKQTNRLIQNKSINKYHKDLKTFTRQFDHHLIDEKWAQVSYSDENEDQIKELFKARYEHLARDLRGYIDQQILKQEKIHSNKI